MEGRDAVRALSKVGGTALKLKTAGAVAVVFIVFLLFLGLFSASMGGQASGADACGGRGTPGVDLGDGDNGAAGGDAKTRKEQIANAKIIDQAAADGGLSGYATLIGLMTALQESTLFNLDHGDRDSRGLFQQRPSQGWGSVEQIMKPTYASRMFFFGDEDGSPRGMVDVRNWEDMDPGRVAQAVQRSEFPDLYAGQEDAARKIAEEAGIDLERAGKGGDVDRENAEDDGTNGDDEDQAEECYPENGGAGKPGKPGEPFHDGTAGWPPEVENPYSVRAAIAFAREEAASGGKDWYRACLAFAARTHGWSFSGVNYAIDHYREMPEKMKHDKDRNPPRGALMYWDTGQRAGHVAVYLGDGKIASNDIKRPGYIDVVPATDIETVWGATYLGWAPPYFPKGG